MIRRPPRSTLSSSSAASDVYKRQDQVSALGQQIAMHIAAARPRFVQRDAVDSSTLEKETALLTEQAMAEGKPEKVVGNIVKGRLNKFFAETVLMDQEFLMGDEDKQSTGKLIKAHGKKIGSELSLTAFECFACGEGIEKKEDNFVDEVASMAGGN
eukprot:TRINITY_DN11723_c0_g1_i1.p1 TRINITY_DN11723_c0_g1~~TRINITY_DN11723_c0_g1_i1.p1  ORF type:complete len:156 (+),score=59.43 TRINITY_DN11723_c0_g1_i1:92-559(+)